MPMTNYLDMPHWAQLRDYKPQYTFNKGVYSFNAYNSYNNSFHTYPHAPSMNTNTANSALMASYGSQFNNTNTNVNAMNQDAAGNSMVIESTGHKKDGTMNSETAAMQMVNITNSNNGQSNAMNNFSLSYPFIDVNNIKNTKTNTNASSNAYSYPFMKLENK
jgi:hypothetical protein